MPCGDALASAEQGVLIAVHGRRSGAARLCGSGGGKLDGLGAQMVAQDVSGHAADVLPALLGLDQHLPR